MNILDLFKQMKIEYREHGQHHHTTPGRVNINCPFCSPIGESYRLGWHLREKYFNCWNCGPLRTLDTFMALSGLPFSYVKDLVKGILPEDFYDERRLSHRVEIPDTVGPMKKAHLEYLSGRGFGKKDIARLIDLWDLQGIDHLDPELAWRIFIPIHLDREVVSWTTRSIEEGRRYRSATIEQSKFNIKHLLYGEDRCNPHSIIVTEGPPNVWKIGPGSVATLGLEYTRYQVQRIARYAKRYICMDATEDAQEVAHKLALEVDMVANNGTETFVVELESAKDAGDASGKELKQLKGLLN